jgi:hypothetical protein
MDDRAAFGASRSVATYSSILISWSEIQSQAHDDGRKAVTCCMAKKSPRVCARCTIGQHAAMGGLRQTYTHLSLSIVIRTGLRGVCRLHCRATTLHCPNLALHSRRLEPCG